VPYDVRRADPYSIYDRFEFDVATRQNGDLYDNYLIRLDEIWQSLRILQQAIKQIPQGPINSQKPQYQVRVPAGEAYGRIESPKGELGFYVISNGKPNPWRSSTSRRWNRSVSAPRSRILLLYSVSWMLLWASWIAKGELNYVWKRHSERIKRYLEAILGYLY
jgi:NADH:ubiquinone oxidoreductase subunit D